MSLDPNFSYEDRYGVRPRNRWVIPAVICAVTGISWLIWDGLHHANPQIRSSMISFSPISDREISLRYSVQRSDKNVTVICTLIARDIEKNIVGQIDEEFGPGLASFQKTTAIAARTKAVFADVAGCRAK